MFIFLLSSKSCVPCVGTKESVASLSRSLLMPWSCVSDTGADACGLAWLACSGWTCLPEDRKGTSEAWELQQEVCEGWVMTLAIGPSVSITDKKNPPWPLLLRGTSRVKGQHCPVHCCIKTRAVILPCLRL